MTDERSEASGRRHDERARPMMEGRGLDVVALWPELFEDLDELERNAIRQTCASHCLDGWVPTYGEVSNLVDHARGLITESEYMRRAAENAVRQASEGHEK